jgi:uncharacterized Zn-binding protein involved in type VI secretion
MGLPACRLGDICTGHGCFPPRPNIEGSNNVMINNRPAHREGDAWAVHCCLKCHSSVLAKGSSTVFTNGRGAARIGDLVACGSLVMTGSHNVLIGG